MKFPLLLILLLDFPPLKGQKDTHILLRLTFPSYYNSHIKYCCKLYPGECYKLLDNTGYTCGLLNGRVTITESDGWIEFEISNVQSVDRGYYRCVVQGTQNPIYKDYNVDLSEFSGHHIRSQPSLTATIKAPKTTTELPDSTEDNTARLPWSFGLSFAVIASSIVMILIAAVIAVVCRRVKAKRKQSDKYGETLRESPKQETPGMSDVVYTAVDFRAHQRPSGAYANLRMHKTQMEAPGSGCSDGMVEYSILATHQ